MEKRSVIELKRLAKEQGNIPIPTPRTNIQRPIPTPRKNIPNQPQRPIPTPRTNIQRPIPAPRTNIPKQTQRYILDEPVPEINFPPIEPFKLPRQFLDEPVPEINFPILEPSKPISQPKSLKHLVSRVVKPIKKDINKFADWIISYVPEPIKKNVNKRVESLKEKVNRIFKRFKRFTPKEQETALKGYLKTYRIDGQKGHDEKMFIANIKPKVLDLIKKQKKPLKVKFIFTCKFIKENPATRQIDENSGYFHSTVEMITKSTDFSDSFNTMTNRLLESI